MLNCWENTLKLQFDSYVTTVKFLTWLIFRTTWLDLISTPLKSICYAHIGLLSQELQPPVTDPWWRRQMETISALLAIRAGNSPVTGEFTAQRPVTRSFDVFFDLSLNKRSSKHSWGWWFETPPRPLLHHCDALWLNFVVWMWKVILRYLGCSPAVTASGKLQLTHLKKTCGFFY